MQFSTPRPIPGAGSAIFTAVPLVHPKEVSEPPRTAWLLVPKARGFDFGRGSSQSAVRHTTLALDRNVFAKGHLIHLFALLSVGYRFSFINSFCGGFSPTKFWRGAACARDSQTLHD